MNQNIQPSLTLDCAIVGGGVSGIYSAWRLKGHDSPSRQQKVAVFEMSSRVGGRLLTWLPFGKDAGLRAELGGMRLLKPQEKDGKLVGGHQLFYELVGPNGLDLKMVPFHTNDNPDPVQDKTVMLLRRELLYYRLPDMEKIAARYNLETPEKKMPGDLLLYVLDGIMRANSVTDWQHWTRETWDQKKPSLKYDGIPLFQWGFWNLLSTVLSSEGYQYLTDSLGYYTLVRNWNAAEAVSFIAQDFVVVPDFLTLQEGLGHLPTALQEHFEALVEQEAQEKPAERDEIKKQKVYLHHQLTRFEHDGNGGFLLHFYNTNPEAQTDFHQVVQAKKLILALPHWSLKQLEKTPAFDLRGNTRLKRKINTVTGMPAFKLFLLYKKRWWENGNPPGGGIHQGHSVCDLPLRQTYYFKPDDGIVGEYKDWGFLMVSYDDGHVVDYWKGMEQNPEERELGRQHLLQQLEQLHLPLLFTGLQDKEGYVMQNRDKKDTYNLPPNVYQAPSLMIKRAVEQVALLHNRSVDDEELQPVIGAYADWSLDPFGGGWNFWRPQIEALKVMKQMAEESICEAVDGKEYEAYVVGEAYCGIQGWVEGALSTTEVMLQNKFQLLQPQWLPGDYYLGPGHVQRKPSLV